MKKSIQKKEKPISKVTLKALEEMLGDDKDLVLFFLAWFKNGQNATRAYKELHPKVDDASARVLGSRTLARVNIQAIMTAYGLDLEEYFERLKDGLDAWNNNIITTRKGDTIDRSGPDHPTRKAYHDKLGKLLGIEKEMPNNPQQFNFNFSDEIAKSRKERGLNP